MNYKIIILNLLFFYINAYSQDTSSFTDSRDGHVYKTIKIGNQIWMAENLNFKTQKSTCYYDSSDFCSYFGALYSWYDIENISPSGWHIPTAQEWYSMLDSCLFTLKEGDNTYYEISKLNPQLGGMYSKGKNSFVELNKFGMYWGKIAKGNDISEIAFIVQESDKFLFKYIMGKGFLTWKNMEDSPLCSVRCVKDK